MITLTCGVCKIQFGMDDEFYRVAKQGAGRLTWFCTNGHERTFSVGPTEEEKLRKALETQKQQNAMWRDDARRERERAEAAERSASAFKGVTTRLKNRAAAGVCPCCNRTFVNLQRHMAGQHPGFAAPESGEGATIQ